MREPEVIDFYERMTDLGITVWVDGGWGVDSLLGRQTRLHKDLDIAIQERMSKNCGEFWKHKDMKRSSWKSLDRTISC
jgi:lincosamide nucleotidyltransferase A/C/D/E